MWLYLTSFSEFYFIPSIIICVIAFGFPSGKKGRKEKATGSEKPAANTQQSTQPKTEKID